MGGARVRRPEAEDVARGVREMGPRPRPIVAPELLFQPRGDLRQFTKADVRKIHFT